MLRNDFRPPVDHEVDAFVRAYLVAVKETANPLTLARIKKSPITLRLSKGGDINGACGQLASALGQKKEQFSLQQ